ncbi:SOS response-associated peptidase family protein [Leucobacter tenebrionis]|uniref:SOS response-associated peptidase family protein n=1 Tax=Leucobacter tenebrionis TaxID=2873270 RepID=UPI001CA69011|nr:SOS response-associated peptidase family protein [Leucobacter tenebrionis]QZY52939.1 SOS response-associated peptidase [Leucobacter tenebrionis]
MCNSYGLGGYLHDGEEPRSPLRPLDQRESERAIAEWAQGRGGRAAITGSKARNLNPIIRAGSDDRELVFAWWWLWLDSSGPAKFSAFNARDDKLMRSWKKPFQTRALLPADWYVEKKGRFTLPQGEQFGIAAITSTVTTDDGDLITYSMVTRDAPAGSEAAEYWPRMPLVLPRDMHDEWLDPERPGDASLVAEVQHASEEISRELITTAPETPALF